VQAQVEQNQLNNTTQTARGVSIQAVFDAFKSGSVAADGSRQKKTAEQESRGVHSIQAKRGTKEKPDH